MSLSSPKLSLTEQFLHNLKNSARDLAGDKTKPPGPPKYRVPVSLFEFFHDQVRFIEWLKSKYGDMIYIYFGGRHIYVVGKPEWIDEVLVAKNSSFIKGRETRELSAITGDGLLTSHGDHWKRQRKLAAPALKRKHIGNYATQMVDITQRHADHFGQSDTRLAIDDMMNVTLDIVVETLFNVTMPSQQKAFKTAIDTLFEDFDKQNHSFRRFVPRSLQRVQIEKSRKAKKALDDIVYDVISRRRKAPPGDDLLYKLIEAQDDAGLGMTDEQLRDEVITMFIAGHETTAITLTFALYELGRRPELQARIHEELDACLGTENTLGLEHVRQLPLMDALIKESLRLYPPAWVIGRESIEDVQIGPWHIPAGSQVALSPWNVQRDERWFDNPESFEPDRWMDGLEQRLPRQAYFPFGGGQRICIGNHFAKMESILVLATILSKFEVSGPDFETIKFNPFVTLRPETPIHLHYKAREPKPVTSTDSDH